MSIGWFYDGWLLWFFFVMNVGWFYVIFFCVFLWFYVGWFFGDDGLLWFYVEWFLGRFRWNDCFKFGLQVWQVGLCKMGEPHSKYIYMRIGCRLGLIPVSAHPGLYGSRPHHAPIKRKELPTLVHGWGQLRRSQSTTSTRRPEEGKPFHNIYIYIYILYSHDIGICLHRLF